MCPFVYRPPKKNEEATTFYPRNDDKEEKKPLRVMKNPINILFKYLYIDWMIDEIKKEKWETTHKS